ncbi:transposase [uncultured Maribacter sp.]|uniref:transposase n=1 Tax=uncultured Maribacter sp. TaxID=431308 RepID=UPI00261253BC|nr:transposase [uncultured Maribacter sp.]
MQRQHKDYLSDLLSWNQKKHAKNWMLFPKNLGTYLSLDETAFSNGDLYTILTKKKQKKEAVTAMIKGTKAEVVIKILRKIPVRQRKKVKGVTLDMADNMGLIAKKSFPNATQVINRFHVQKLVLDALQEIGIKRRREALDIENDAIENSRNNL